MSATDGITPLPGVLNVGGGGQVSESNESSSKRSSTSDFLGGAAHQASGFSNDGSINNTATGGPQNTVQNGIYVPSLPPGYRGRSSPALGVQQGHNIGGGGQGEISAANVVANSNANLRREAGLNGAGFPAQSTSSVSVPGGGGSAATEAAMRTALGQSWQQTNNQNNQNHQNGIAPSPQVAVHQHQLLAAPRQGVQQAPQRVSLVPRLSSPNPPPSLASYPLGNSSRNPEQVVGSQPVRTRIVPGSTFGDSSGSTFASTIGSSFSAPSGASATAGAPGYSQYNINPLGAYANQSYNASYSQMTSLPSLQNNASYHATDYLHGTSLEVHLSIVSCRLFSLRFTWRFSEPDTVYPHGFMTDVYYKFVKSQQQFMGAVSPRPQTLRCERALSRICSKEGGKLVHNKDKDRFEMPLSCYESTVDFLTNHEYSSNFLITHIPRPTLVKMALVRSEAENSKVYPSVQHLLGLNVPRKIATSLAPFQRAAVRFCVDRKGKAFIADEMGLGKTLQAVATMSVYRAEWPVLIVCPSAARYHWESEFVNWLGKGQNYATEEFEGMGAADLESVGSQSSSSSDDDDDVDNKNNNNDDDKQPKKNKGRDGFSRLAKMRASSSNKSPKEDSSDSDSDILDVEEVKKDGEVDIDSIYGDSEEVSDAVSIDAVSVASSSSGDFDPLSKKKKAPSDPGFFIDRRHTCVVNSGKDTFRESHKVVICSYGLLSNMVNSKRIIPGQFKCIIIDESHMLKNRKAKRTQAIQPLLFGAKRRILLSGTPALAKPLELFTQVESIVYDKGKTEKNVLEKDYFTDYEMYKKRYCKKITGSNTEELYATLATVMIRRLKKDMLKALPPKRRLLTRFTIQDEEMRAKIEQNLLLLRDHSKGRLGTIAKSIEEQRQKRLTEEGIEEITLEEALKLASEHAQSEAMKVRSFDSSQSEIDAIAKGLLDTISNELKNGFCQRSFMEKKVLKQEACQLAPEEVEKARKIALMKLFQDSGVAKVRSHDEFAAVATILKVF